MQDGWHYMFSFLCLLDSFCLYWQCPKPQRGIADVFLQIQIEFYQFQNGINHFQNENNQF